MTSLHNEGRTQAHHVQPERRFAKLMKRRAISAPPSPLQIPSPLALELEHQARLTVEFEHAQESQASPLFRPPSSHCSPHQRPTAFHTPTHRQQLESQLHSVLQQLDKASPEPLPAYRADLASPRSSTITDSVFAVRQDVLPSTSISRDRSLTSSRTYQVPPPPPRMFTKAPHLQARVNTLFRKASQLCQMSETEVYMIVRFGGKFCVYNSDDAASRSAPKPEAYEQVVNVAVAGSSDGQMV